ncbi:MAG: hypothetical protein HQL63_06100 [Magnetococcales bacterium]|nr:hypothetical protein [Magnetococcales bacterium]MBF0321331.1 hypothetical protein [Magnetococcales bacterium]
MVRNDTMSFSEKTSSDRAFGLVFAVIFGCVGLIPVLRGAPPRVLLLVIAGILLTVALAVPALLHPFNRLWLAFGDLLHHVMNPIIMGVVFFVVITPISLLMRLFGKDTLRLRTDAKATSYWIIRTPPGPEPESCKNQF